VKSIVPSQFIKRLKVTELERDKEKDNSPAGSQDGPKHRGPLGGTHVIDCPLGAREAQHRREQILPPQLNCLIRAAQEYVRAEQRPCDVGQRALGARRRLDSWLRLGLNRDVDMKGLGCGWVGSRVKLG
jgi:hypothetical protein